MEAFLNIIGAALEQLMYECERLRDYLQNNVAGSGIDIPDEVWVPFTAALAFAEKASTSANSHSVRVAGTLAEIFEQPYYRRAQ
jgi:hypothetical protein